MRGSEESPKRHPLVPSQSVACRHYSGPPVRCLQLVALFPVYSGKFRRRRSSRKRESGSRGFKKCLITPVGWLPTDPGGSNHPLKCAPALHAFVLAPARGTRHVPLNQGWRKFLLRCKTVRGAQIRRPSTETQGDLAVVPKDFHNARSRMPQPPAQ